MSFASIVLERRLSDQLARAAREGADLSLPMAEISEQMLEDTRRRFEAEVAPGGVPWKKSRRSIRDGGKTLQERGFLIRGLHRRSGATFAEVGVRNNAPQNVYAEAHQTGVNKQVQVKAHTRTIKQAFGKRLANAVVANIGAFTRQMNIPARPYLGFDLDEIEAIKDILIAHLRRIFGAAA